jgi:hypothetical protein
MTDKKIDAPRMGGERLLESIDERAEAEARHYGALTGGQPEPYLAWFGGLICVVLAVVALAAIAYSAGRFEVGRPPPVAAALEPGQVSPPPTDRLSCAQMGNADLRSPLEGLWFQASCLPGLDPSLTALITNCNRTSLDAGFTLVGPGLYVFRPAQSASAFLWYASSPTCFDLVSTRVVTAVCGDSAVTFKWDTRSACAGHGGILAAVNGR